MSTIEVRPVKKSEMDIFIKCLSRGFAKDLENISVPGFVSQNNNLKLTDEFYWGVFVDNIPVAGLIIIPLDFIIGYSTFHVVGFTGVATDPDHRHHGYATRLIQGVFTYLKQSGYDGVILQSSADLLYRKNGFGYTFWEWAGDLIWSKSTESNYNSEYLNESSRKDEDIKIEFLLPSEVSLDNCAVFNQIRERSPQYLQHKFRTIRSDRYFKAKFEQHNAIIPLICYNNENFPIAYLFAKFDNGKNEINVFEQYSLSNKPEIFISMWKALKDEFDFEEIKFKFDLYSEDEVVKNLITEGGGNVYKCYKANKMATFFDTYATLQRLIPTFSYRISSLAIETPFKFVLLVEDEGFLFTIHTLNLNIQPFSSNAKSDLPQFKLSRDEWIALVFGYIEIDDVETYENPDLEKLEPILHVIFPEIEPIWDYFQTY
jgi:GNAT superfamily N-acetyltransferase